MESVRMKSKKSYVFFSRLYSVPKRMKRREGWMHECFRQLYNTVSTVWYFEQHGSYFFKAVLFVLLRLLYFVKPEVKLISVCGAVSKKYCSCIIHSLAEMSKGVSVMSRLFDWSSWQKEQTEKSDGLVPMDAYFQHAVSMFLVFSLFFHHLGAVYMNHFHAAFPGDSSSFWKWSI